MNPDDYEVAAQYESPNRYLITFTHRSSNDPAVGFVLKRHGLATWKFSEIRLLPQQKTRLHTILNGSEQSLSQAPDRHGPSRDTPRPDTGYESA